MQSFPFFIQLGFVHISDLASYDHILFLVALCAVYRIEQWRIIGILVTAFTVGHSITLALAALQTLSIPSKDVAKLCSGAVFRAHPRHGFLELLSGAIDG